MATILFAALFFGTMAGSLVLLYRLRARLRLAEARTDFLLHRDPLTGLPNGVLAKDRLERLAAHSGRNGTKVAVIAIDLDHFASINESLGYRHGDAVIREVGLRLAAAVRDSDTVIRQGGDRFLLLLGEVRDLDAIVDLTSKVQERIAQPCLVDGHETRLTGSLGIAVWPDDGLEYDTLADKANTALSHSKQAGRAGHRFFAERMNWDSVQRARTLGALKRAVDNGEFVLHYQPQVEITSGRITGVEALIRWRSPTGDLIPPGRFIPLAEQSGLIVPIGEWVLWEACRQAAEWQRRLAAPPSVAVNVSALQFARGDIDRKVLSAVDAHGILPTQLEIEITESVLLKDSEETQRSVRKLAQVGVTFSIDDFGTGYSSLSYLQRFAVHKLKIDQSFVRQLRHQPGSTAIVRAIIQMARGLDLQTIAEGIEDQWSLDVLGSHGCDYAQGYHLGRPMPAEDLAALLAQPECLPC